MGWTEEQALASLAARICELKPEEVLTEAGTTSISVATWLIARAPMPRLEDA